MEQSKKSKSGNVLPGPRHIKKQEERRKYSILGVFLAMILFGVLVMLGERIIFDLNRFINPVVDQEYTKFKNLDYSLKRGLNIESPQMPVRSFEMAKDSTGVVSGTRVYYSAMEKGRYMMWKLIIHAAVIIPLFVFSFVLYYLKRNNYQLKPLLASAMLANFWLMFHLLIETIAFVMNEYRNIAIYVILIILSIVFGGLAYYSQMKHVTKK